MNDVTATAKAKTDKAVKGIKLANARVPKAIKAISLVGNLASYDLSPAQVKQVIAALKSAVARVEDRLSGASQKQESDFNLS